ncbi:MAG: hypothetical protein J7518_05110 [Nocardioidaceae bacterium]|nr:hypothetical protein [Nocardioidaceae bacterium]
MRREATRVAIALGAGALAVTGVYAGTAHAHTDGMDGVRAATAKYHAIPAAEADGYGDPGLPCFDNRATGEGMGTHLVNGGLLNDGGALDRNEPEALVYEVHQGQNQLVAVEYLVKMSDAAEAPHFLGQQMIPNPGLGLWTLHAWIWRKNPANLFASYNANVPLCP